MAAQGEIPEQMMREHRGGYECFVTLMKWGAISSFVTALIVIFLIS